eukprot:2848887-Prymnesium_polylepis.2
MGGHEQPLRVDETGPIVGWRANGKGVGVWPRGRGDGTARQKGDGAARQKGLGVMAQRQKGLGVMAQRQKGEWWVCAASLAGGELPYWGEGQLLGTHTFKPGTREPR